MYERIACYDGIETLEKIKTEINRQANLGHTRLSIEVHFFDPTCGSCHKVIKVGEEHNQYGFTQCYECYKLDRDFDEDFS